ncbi:MAG: diguanylate cyclase [Curvibacter sp.]|nr:diguanylate cyclase [Curvibacter sp.]
MRNWRTLHETLKFRVVLVTVVSALLASSVSVFFVIQGSQREAMSRVEMRQLDEARLLAALMDSRLEQTQDLLDLLGHDVLSEATRLQGPAQPLWASRESTLAVFDFVDLDDADGQPRSRRGQLAPSLDPEIRQLREQTLVDGKAGVRTVLDTSRARPVVEVLMSWPVRDGQGLLRAVLLAGLPLASSQLMPPAGTPAPGADALTVLLDAEGRILSGTEEARLLTSAQDEAGLRAAYQAWQSTEASQRARGLSVDADERLSSLARLRTTGWVVLRITSMAQALAPYRALRRSAWWLTAAVAGLCASAAAVLILWLTRPIGLLHRRMRQALDRSVPADQGWPMADGEIGRLVKMMREVAVAQDREHQSLRLMAGQLEAILTYASVGIVVSRHRRLELLGHRASAMLGYEPGELLGQPARVLYPSDEAYAELGEAVRSQFVAQGHFDGELLFRRKDGSDFWVHMLGRGVVPDDPDGGTIWIFDDITSERAARQALSWSATHDGLTGLVNRSELEGRVGTLLHGLKTGAEAPACLLFVDLDYFKAINDSAGHAAGDWVLQQMARLMESQVRQSDTVARLGGDEFALLLPACQRERAMFIAQSLCNATEAWRIELAEQVFHIGASIGLVEIVPAFDNVAAVLHAADMACYAAKRAGRSQVVSSPGASVPA